MYLKHIFIIILIRCLMRWKMINMVKVYVQNTFYIRIVWSYDSRVILGKNDWEVVRKYEI